jgi:electron transfer flavoprotein beta subunit
LQIAMLLKQVPDTATRIQVRADGQGIVTDGIKWVMNPYDEFALEEALQIREREGGEVVLFAVGPARVEDTIRQGLAMGADRAVRIDDAGIENADHLVIARVLAAALRREPWDLIWCGKQAVDDDAAQVGPLVAVELGLPQAMVVLGITVNAAERRLVVRRELEGAEETVELPMPAVLGAQRGLNTPRYPTLPNIMKAKRKPLETLTVGDLGLNREELVAGQRVVVESYFAPPGRPEPKILTGDPVEAARELVRLLHDEAHVI